MQAAPTIAAVPDGPAPRATLEPQTLACVGPDVRGHRHIVDRHDGAVVAFLCGRWRPEIKVVRIDGSRRHPHVCHTCYKTWERLHKERAS